MIDPCEGCSQPLDSWVCKGCFFYADSGLVLSEAMEKHPELFLSDEVYEFWEEYHSQLVLDRAGC